MAASNRKRRSAQNTLTNNPDVLSEELDVASELPHQWPVLLHRFRHDRSILALVATNSHIFAASQGGEILVYALRTFERVKVIEAHQGSILGLCLSPDEHLLFSSASDRFVNVWNTQTYQHVASIYSNYDLGDIFSISFSARLGTLYMGCQNTSIQWYDLRDFGSRPPPNPQSHPSQRQDRFFDSIGPGGIRTPRYSSAGKRRSDAHGGRDLEIPNEQVYQFAHHGYVYCTLLAKGFTCGFNIPEILISAGGDGIIRFWKLDEKDHGRISPVGKLEDESREDGDSILSITLDGSFLYSGRLDGEINVWNVEARQLVRILRPHDGDVLCTSVLRGFMFSGDIDGIIKKINPRHQCVESWAGHEGKVLSSTLKTFNDRLLLITGGSDNSIAIWDASDCLASSTTGEAKSTEELIDSLSKFISYRTVSSDARYKPDCHKGASYLSSVFKALGGQSELLKTDNGSNPIVYARFRATGSSPKSSKKILFYGHYDVIAAENKQQKWRSDPFVLTGTDGYLYGRGASDNKGPIMAAIYAVAQLKSEQGLASDVVFLIEGEEECGSRDFRESIQRNKELIGPIHWILVANSYWLDDEVPCLTYGLRGVIHARVEIQSDQPDLHSGVDGSRLLDEPLKDLVLLIGQLAGPKGIVQIPNFYERVLPVTAYEASLYSDISRSLLERDPSLGTAKDLTVSLMERWRDASITVHGFKTSGSEESTIIPHVASVGLSLRIVPNQGVDQVTTSLVSFLKNKFIQLESKNKLSVIIDHQADPWLGDYNNEIFQVLEKAIVEVWSEPSGQRRPSTANSSAPSRQGHHSSPSSSTPATSSTLASSSLSPTASVFNDTLGQTPLSSPRKPQRLWKPLYIREGGSIPAIRFLEKEFGAPAAHLPCGQASDNAHLENERFRVLNLLNSRAIFKKVFEELPKR